MSGVTTTDTEVVAAETERERESAYVSRKRMWRTPPEPSSRVASLLVDYVNSVLYFLFSLNYRGQWGIIVSVKDFLIWL